MDREPLRERERERVEENDSLQYTRKKISTWIVELIYNETGSGGAILIWETGKENLDHIWPNTKFEGQWYHKADEVNFRHTVNARDEYRNLDTVSDLNDLMYRNM